MIILLFNQNNIFNYGFVEPQNKNITITVVEEENNVSELLETTFEEDKEQLVLINITENLDSNIELDNEASRFVPICVCLVVYYGILFCIQFLIYGL